MSNKIKIITYTILLILFLISLGSSLIISTQPTSVYCGVEDGGGESGCNIVQNSSYASIFGIKNSHFGVIIFTLLSIITYLQILSPSKRKKQIIYLGIMVSSLIAIYFIYLQQFVLHSYCNACMVVDISMLIALGIMLYDSKWLA